MKEGDVLYWGIRMRETDMVISWDVYVERFSLRGVVEH